MTSYVDETQAGPWETDEVHRIRVRVTGSALPIVALWSTGHVTAGTIRDLAHGVAAQTGGPGASARVDLVYVRHEGAETLSRASLHTFTTVDHGQPFVQVTVVDPDGPCTLAVARYGTGPAVPADCCPAYTAGDDWCEHRRAAGFRVGE